jgi:putative FmdB family regulatory protein
LKIKNLGETNSPVLTLKEKLMPIFEFVCQECGAPFEELVRSSSAIGEVFCPFCESTQVTKQISTFASSVVGSVSSFSSAQSASCSSGSL